MAHEELKKLLEGDQGKLIVKSVTQSMYAWAWKVPAEYYNYRVFNELTVRYETGEKTRLGLKKFDHFRFDSVFFIEPGYRALDQRQCYTIGIELKQSKSDLMSDKKMEKYLALRKAVLDTTGDDIFVGKGHKFTPDSSDYERAA